MKPCRKMFLGLICSLLVIILFAIVANMDYEDSVSNNYEYCVMVEKGAWPDFKGIFEKECEKVLTPESK